MTPTAPTPTFRQALARGLRKKCPRCGQGPLFEGWHRLRERCPVCGLAFEERTGDTWFFMYMTTAGMTGVLVVAMFLVRPRVLWVGQLVVALIGLALMGLSLPYRKGVAVALDYLIERGGQKKT